MLKEEAQKHVKRFMSLQKRIAKLSADDQYEWSVEVLTGDIESLHQEELMLAIHIALFNKDTRVVVAYLTRVEALIQSKDTNAITYALGHIQDMGGFFKNVYERRVGGLREVFLQVLQGGLAAVGVLLALPILLTDPALTPEQREVVDSYLSNLPFADWSFLATNDTSHAPKFEAALHRWEATPTPLSDKQVMRLLATAQRMGVTLTAHQRYTLQQAISPESGLSEWLHS